MSDQLIDDYVRELRTSAWIRQLPAQRTAALEKETRERIAAQLEAAGKHDDATVHSVLDRLGPASDIVANEGEAPPAGARKAINSATTPLARLRFLFASRGWGAAEIGGLLLLIVGPFLLWWIGPIIGIIVVRAAADRWSERAEHVATVIVFSLLGVQAILSVLLLVYVLLSGGSLGNELQRLMSSFSTNLVGAGLTSGGEFVDSGPLFVVRVLGALLAPIAGVTSGLYLLLSPRFRR